MRINACKNLRRQSRGMKVVEYFTYLERSFFTKGFVKEANIITVGSNRRQLFAGIYCYAPSGIVGRCPVESHREKSSHFFRRRRSAQLSAFLTSRSTRLPSVTDMTSPWCELTDVLSTSIPACLPTRSSPASQPRPCFGCQNTRHEIENRQEHQTMVNNKAPCHQNAAKEHPEGGNWKPHWVPQSKHGDS